MTVCIAYNMDQTRRNHLKQRGFSLVVCSEIKGETTRGRQTLAGKRTSWVARSQARSRRGNNSSHFEPNDIHRRLVHFNGWDVESHSCKAWSIRLNKSTENLLACSVKNLTIPSTFCRQLGCLMWRNMVQEETERVQFWKPYWRFELKNQWI